MRNIIDLLGSQEIKRIRVGIGNDRQMDTADYVLGKVPLSERKIYKESLKRAADAVIYYLDNGFQKVMSIYNQ